MDSECNSIESPSTCVCGKQLEMIHIQVQAITGTKFNLKVAKNDTVDFIRKVISTKTKMAKEKILLLHKDRWVQEFKRKVQTILEKTYIGVRVESQRCRM